MNLFFLDENSSKNAEYHVDKHVGKLILEAMQIVCTTFHLQDIKAPYRPSHQNHPTSIWSRQSEENFEWTLEYARSLGQENYIRNGKWHKSLEVLDWAKANQHLLCFPKTGFTEFALAMPDNYKTDCPIQSYRNYYREAKKHLHSWKNRDKPEWL